MLTRRHVLTSAAAALALPFAPRRLWAATTLSLGTMQIDSLSDGNLMLPGDFILGGMPQDEMAAIMAKYNLPTDTLTPLCNVTLLRDGTNTVLFDVGAGPHFQPTAGKLANALDALGVTAEDITHVVFTHGHPDHLWGLLDDFDEPVFMNARHMIGQAEFDYWMDPATVDSIGEARTTFAVGAQRRLEIMAEQLEMVTDGAEILPGIAARLTPGHTPGHMAYEVREGSNALMVVGDALGNHHVAFERPDWASGSDQDGALAAQTRVALLDQIATDQIALIGYHLPGGGIGRAERSGDTYRFAEDV
jgi:glyoxylase-like metal-dependent hydrolase (beta-lactamase superfamily II)